MTIEEKLTLGIAVITGVKWVYEYTKKLTWDKNKFLLERYEKFKSKESTKAMQLLLDWNKITITLNSESMRVDDNMLWESFQTHDIKTTFTKDEASLRKLFDEYLDDLNEFRLLSETGLISEKNYRLFMKYWFDILTGKKSNKPKKVLSQIESYMKYYGYNDLFVFMNI
jgi:hypothetical protein